MTARAGGAAGSPRAAARRGHPARLLVFVLLALGATAAWHWRAILDPLAISTVIEGYRVAPLLFLGIHVAASLLFVPRTMLAIVAGLLFGMGWGIVWAEIGSVAGAVAGFVLARYVNSGLFSVERNARIRPVLERVEGGGWRAVALLRLIPILPHSLTNYGLGLTRLPLSSYAFGSVIGQLPMTIAYVDLGAAGGQLILGRSEWLEPTLIGLAALSVSVAIPAFSHWRGRAKQPSMPSAEGLL